MTRAAIRRRRLVRLLRLFEVPRTYHKEYECPPWSRPERAQCARAIELNYWRLDDKPRALLDLRFGLLGDPSWSASKIAALVGRRPSEIDKLIQEIRWELIPVILAVKIDEPAILRRTMKKLWLTGNRNPRAALRF